MTEIQERPVAVGKILPPLARQLAESMAVEVGACVRPVAVRRTDQQTGHSTVIPIRCGATLASKCPTCAEKARRERMWQAQAGWHLEHEPVVERAEPTPEQYTLIDYRATLAEMKAEAIAEDAGPDELAELDADITAADAMLRDAGVRGSLTRPRTAKRRSTRRRQDKPNLPQRRVAPTTVGRVFEAPDGKTYRPSTFITVTLDSYGRVHPDGSPVDPDTYQYVRAARDAIHFGAVIDRLWTNLRRGTGRNLQYFAVVEPQRRGAPHLHAAIRGTIPRAFIKEVVAATYYDVWWPPHDEPIYTDRLPIWDETRDEPGYVDPDTLRPLQTWDEATDPEVLKAPTHTVHLGRQVDIQGVLEGSGQAGTCLGYLVKYLTKSVAECHEPETGRAAAHVQRMTETLRYEPCSPTCPNWLRYGVQPKHPNAGQIPGMCRGKAHRAEHLGYGGRRCLVSRKWSGKTVAEHRMERRGHVFRVLGAVGAKVDNATPDEQRDRYRWKPIRPGDADQPDRLELLLRAIAQARNWRAQYQQAKELSATVDQEAA